MKEDEVLDLINRGVVSLEVLQAAIDMAEFQLKERQEAERKANRFPHQTTIYLHSDDDSMFSHFLNEGFSEAEIEKWDLHNVAYEVGLNIEIDAEGKIKFLGLKGGDYL